jgi:hypothetical protein
MLARCKHKTRYKNHAGKGISVCQRWQTDFLTFLADMGQRPSPEHSIERIDGKKGYEPGNCRWATAKEQARNKCNNRIIEFRGEKRCLAEWAEILGLSYSCLKIRLKKWSIERAFTTPPIPVGKYERVKKRNDP